MLNGMICTALFFNCYVIGRIVATDCTNCDMFNICRCAFAALVLDTVILTGFILI